MLNMDHLEMLHMFRDKFKTTENGSFRIGEFVDLEKPELTEELDRIIERVRE